MNFLVPPGEELRISRGSWIFISASHSKRLIWRRLQHSGQTNRIHVCCQKGEYPFHIQLINKPKSLHILACKVVERKPATLIISYLIQCIALLWRSPVVVLVGRKWKRGAGWSLLESSSCMGPWEKDPMWFSSWTWKEVIASTNECKSSHIWPNHFCLCRFFGWVAESEGSSVWRAGSVLSFSGPAGSPAPAQQTRRTPGCQRSAARPVAWIVITKKSLIEKKSSCIKNSNIGYWFIINYLLTSDYIHEFMINASLTLWPSFNKISKQQFWSKPISHL